MNFLKELKNKPETQRQAFFVRANQVVKNMEDDNCYPGWEYINCGCCGGIQWGGDTPRDCLVCDGASFYYKHTKSGVLAQYPGGPFLGREPIDEQNKEAN